MPEMKRATIADLQRSRAEGYVSVYSNHTEATPGFYELGLRVCQIGKGIDGNLLVNVLADVSITWEHAVRIRDLLNRMIEAYEKENGKIRLLREDEPEAHDAPPAVPNPPRRHMEKVTPEGHD